MKTTKRICANGHVFYKSSTCNSCPTCEKNKELAADFFAGLAAPARRALENAKIVSVDKLAKYSEQELLQLHGLGKSSLPKLRAALLAAGLDFRK